MTPEATALAERLVGLVLRSNHPDNDGPELDLSGCPEWVRLTTVMGSLPDLDHPSNEGHLRLLAQEVLGYAAYAHLYRPRPPGRPGWVCHERTKRATPGQAYAAAIVAAIQEGEKPEEKG